MSHIEEFRKRAEQCRQAAKTTRDRVGRAKWQLLAVRWEQCIQVAKGTATPPAGKIRQIPIRTGVRSRSDRASARFLGDPWAQHAARGQNACATVSAPSSRCPASATPLSIISIGSFVVERGLEWNVKKDIDRYVREPKRACGKSAARCLLPLLAVLEPAGGPALKHGDRSPSGPGSIAQRPGKRAFFGWPLGGKRGRVSGGGEPTAAKFEQEPTMQAEIGWDGGGTTASV
jgi:hypothetical protein